MIASHDDLANSYLLQDVKSIGSEHLSKGVFASSLLLAQTLNPACPT
jgi:hypothetical protein